MNGCRDTVGSILNRSVIGLKEFHCGDVVPGCKKTFREATDEDILAQVAVHAQQDHGMTEIPVALVEQVRSLIRPTA